MNDVWVLGSAAWDLVYEIDRVPQVGGTATARRLGRRAGGSSGNVARALASAGHRVHLVSQVGTDEPGTALLRELASWDVLTEHVLRRGPCTPETLIFVDRKGERTIVVLDKDCTEVVPVPYAAMKQAEAVYVGRYSDFEQELPQILRRLPATVVTAVPPIDDTADWFAHVVVGSSSEFPKAWLAEPYEALRDRVGTELRWTVVTNGAMGATAYGPGEEVHLPPVETLVADATGAGDSFTAGLLHGMLTVHDVRTAGQLGTYWAAMALQTMQSVPPRWEELGIGPAHGNWIKALADTS